MKGTTDILDQIQHLIIDVIGVERNHFIPKTNRHENVAEHSFSLAMLCWRIFEMINPPLDLSKILKYSIIHDFTERGLSGDINTYANSHERHVKKEREARELIKLCSEFEDFTDFVALLRGYDINADEEAKFVWSIDKMQAIILGQIDEWRPYANYGVTYKVFCDKGNEFLDKCSPFLIEIFKEVLEKSSKTYYDNPAIKSNSKQKALH